MRTKLVTAPYTAVDGVSIPIQIHALGSKVGQEGLCKISGFLATGCPVCYISKSLATQLGVTDEPYFCMLSIGVVMKEAILWPSLRMPYGDKHDVVLGMSFLNQFEVVFDGPGQIASLYDVSGP